MAEDLTDYLTEHGVKVRYLHSDIDTLERIEIIRDLRLGVFDVLVGHQPAARGARHSGMRAGGDPGRRQGRLPALADLADPDHRPRRAQHRRPGDPVCRHDDHGRCAPRSRKPNGAATSSAPGTRRTASRRISIRKQIGKVLESVFEQDYVTVAPVKDAGVAEFVGKDLKAAIAELEKRMRAAAAEPGIRGGRAAARRDQAAGGAGPRPGTAADAPAPRCGRSGDRTPEPMGPGGGGYDPSKRRGKGGMRRKGP